MSNIPQQKKTLIERINFRNILASMFTVGYLTYLYYYSEKVLIPSTDGIVNPSSDVLSLLLGILSLAEGLIVQFFFRKPSSKES